ncbi:MULTISPECIES: DUF3040 domain-containing protein [Micromonospora]|uniref:DUF3040 domain-containing protein n=1 Tax=Micromonospora solifontis TaxID=2487138 RepID=A0ABX9WE09_9ACTN|nr:MULTISPECIES: DUF3040 domain-containing protein [Micromonospora]NES16985.1 DUF3040 domain-containing protein [Micromonospora sp. PPF5-17B]NES38398.1 DUF3040 domain-containing protein [Micromonospora solifontis]NES58734.1 DUF3040 domain-containing protein [Micromonospora sp. PPF5-6]RNL95813.1 DUF3040 domain-containing protein [Micromonospora solifontis]
MRDDADRFDELVANLTTDDPEFVESFRRGRPAPPREYRQARRHRGLLLLGSASSVVLSAAQHSRPLLSGALLLLALASALASALVTCPHLDAPT